MHPRNTTRYVAVGKIVEEQFATSHRKYSLTCLALLFTIKMRLNTRIETPLLSTRDITELLDYYLPRKGLSEDEVLAQIRQRHRQRQMDVDRRKLQRPGLPAFN